MQFSLQTEEAHLSSLACSRRLYKVIQLLYFIRKLFNITQIITYTIYVAMSVCLQAGT